MDNKITVGIGVLAVAGVGYYLYTKNKKNENVPTSDISNMSKTEGLTQTVNTPKVSTFDRDKASREFAKFAFPILEKRAKDANNGLNLTKREELIKAEFKEIARQEALNKLRIAQYNHDNARSVGEKASTLLVLQKIKNDASQYLNAFGTAVGTAVGTAIPIAYNDPNIIKLSQSLVKYRGAMPIESELSIYKKMLEELNKITDDSDAEFFVNEYKKIVELGERGYKPDLDTLIRIDGFSKKYPNVNFGG